jgi:type VI protein secretion system component VasK
MRTSHFALTVALRVGIITTSLTGVLILASIAWAAKPQVNAYNNQTFPIAVSSFALALVTVVWMSVTLSFLLYMSWRVRSAASGTYSLAGFPTSVAPSSAANARRQASSAGLYD